jgi:hypothetical protein
LNGPWIVVAAPCARLQSLRGPVREYGRVRPFNGIVRGHPLTSPEREYSTESRWVTVIICTLGTVGGAVCAIYEDRLANLAMAMGFAILGVVGWRHPFAYDRPTGGGLRRFLGMAVRDRLLMGAVAVLFATSLILFLG